MVFPTEKSQQLYLFHSETENMADSHPQTGFAELEPFLAHQKPLCCPEALCVSLCVILEGPASPLKGSCCLCASPDWALAGLHSSGCPLRCWICCLSAAVVFLALDQNPLPILPLTSLQTLSEILSKPRPRIST